MDANLVYLAQTDTTVGFLSQNAERLAAIKGRESAKPFIKAFATLKELKKTATVHRAHRRRLRISKKTTFICPNGVSVRVVREGGHHEFLKKFDWMYTTSANIAGENFDERWAKEAANVIVESGEGFKEEMPSKIFVLRKKKLFKLR